jgi:hypothetical protein
VTDWSVGWVVTAGALHEPTLTVPLPVEESPDSPASALTVNGVDPDGVAIVVERVKVDDFELSVVEKLSELGLKDAMTPVGSAEVTDSAAVNAPAVVPLRVTVTGYVALPAVPAFNVPFWALTVTVPTRFATVSVSCCVPSITPFPWQFAARCAVAWKVYVPAAVVAVVLTVSDEV